ncbi:hypothetical protein DSM112329_01823 [Paraconexibacter sp. AEG42_29]|uniref:Suppressor of fused-like domain-containing protein n=1 Tax=Paraconexibacter sp. AEG42_29 TaxID=2997339 RepID=A0AAU7ATI2_9ACTN
MTDEAQAPGWDSIEAAFGAVYGEAGREHRAPQLAQQPPAAGGVLNGISAYRARDYWHFVTFGLTDLFVRTSGDHRDPSGFGHELTLITPRGDGPPQWAFDLLLGTARVCVTHSRPFHAGARLAPGAPVDGASSKLLALGLREDPVVTPSDFPFGRYVLLQAVGVTDMEYRLMQRAGTLTVLDALARRDPLLRTDPERG